MYKAIFIAILIGVSLSVNAQVEIGRRVTEKLCDSSFFGRGYVHNGMNNAAIFLADEFTSAGLKPIFEDSYFQNFSLDVNTFPENVSLMYHNENLSHGIDFLVHPLSGSANGNFNFFYLDSALVYDNFNLPFYQNILDTSKYDGFAIDLTDLQYSTSAELEKLAISLANYFPVILLTDKKLDWAVGRWQLKQPLLYVKKDVVSLNDLSFNLNVKAIYDNFEVANVVGFLPANKRKAKTIVFTAHYDHLGGIGDEVYFPGANDNASGTSMLVALADYLSKQNKRKYNFMFIAFAAEEAGLVGSKYFVDNNSYDLSNIKLLLNLDIMGSGEEGITVVNATEYPKQFKKLVKLNDKLKLVPQVKERGPSYNSDHAPFHEKDVPSFFIYTIGANKNYHDIYDTYENLTFQAYDNVVNLLIKYISTGFSQLVL